MTDMTDGRSSVLGDKVTAATSSTSLYDNVSSATAAAAAATTGGASIAPGQTKPQTTRQTRDRETSTTGGKLNHISQTAGSQTDDVSS